MNNIERAELVSYKMVRASETLAEVKTQLENKFYHTAVNRLYYACFYAVSALLVNNEIVARKHAGVKQMFGLHYVAKEKVSVELGSFYSSIFEKRQRGDYEDFIFFTEEDIKAWSILAEKLISRIVEILSEEQNA